jgi:enamine deaminase RidA (YjgF/YER057c/UK114 family)
MLETFDARLAAMDLDLPAIASPVGSFQPAVRCGNLVFVSGQIPRDAEGNYPAGRVGEEYTVDEAQLWARNAGLFLIAVIRQTLGSLDAVRRVVKLTGYVNAKPGFGQHPVVVNGCSDLMVEVFGERGEHARAAVGVASLPFNVPVEIDAIFEVE